MIFATSEPPQYVVVWFVCCEVKDIIVYRNTIKFACFRPFQEKAHLCFHRIAFYQLLRFSKLAKNIDDTSDP